MWLFKVCRMESIATNDYPLAQSLELRSGTTLKNRICKASMNEALAEADGSVTASFHPLYATWANGGAHCLFKLNAGQQM